MDRITLKAARLILMMKTEQAADLIGGVSKRTWERWESGKTEIPTDTKENIAILLNTDSYDQWLAGREDSGLNREYWRLWKQQKNNA